MSEKPSRRVREGFSLANPFSGATELRKQYAVHGRQPIFLHPFSGATELR